LPEIPNKIARGVDTRDKIAQLPKYSGPPGLPHQSERFKVEAVKVKAVNFQPVVTVGTYDSKKAQLVRDQHGQIEVKELNDNHLPNRSHTPLPHQSAWFKVEKRRGNDDPPSNTHVGDFYGHVGNKPDGVSPINVHLNLVRKIWGKVWGVLHWGSNQTESAANHQPKEPLKTDSPKNKPSKTLHDNNKQHGASPGPPKSKVTNAGKPWRANQPKSGVLDKKEPSVEDLENHKIEIENKHALIKNLKRKNKIIKENVKGITISEIDEAIDKLTKEIKSIKMRGALECLFVLKDQNKNPSLTLHQPHKAFNMMFVSRCGAFR